MKQVITEEDWNKWQTSIVVDYTRDNHFSELKDAELLQNRLQTLDNMQQYVGEFFSKEYILKNVLHLDDDDIKNMQDQIAKEKASGDIDTDDEDSQE